MRDESNYMARIQNPGLYTDTLNGYTFATVNGSTIFKRNRVLLYDLPWPSQGIGYEMPIWVHYMAASVGSKFSGSCEWTARFWNFPQKTTAVPSRPAVAYENQLDQATELAYLPEPLLGKQPDFEQHVKFQFELEVLGYDVKFVPNPPFSGTYNVENLKYKIKVTQQVETRIANKQFINPANDYEESDFWSDNGYRPVSEGEATATATATEGDTNLKVEKEWVNFTTYADDNYHLQYPVFYHSALIRSGLYRGSFSGAVVAQYETTAEAVTGNFHINDEYTWGAKSAVFPGQMGWFDYPDLSDGGIHVQNGLERTLANPRLRLRPFYPTPPYHVLKVDGREEWKPVEKWPLKGREFDLQLQNVPYNGSSYVNPIAFRPVATWVEPSRCRAIFSSWGSPAAWRLDIDSQTGFSNSSPYWYVGNIARLTVWKGETMRYYVWSHATRAIDKTLATIAVLNNPLELHFVKASDAAIKLSAWNATAPDAPELPVKVIAELDRIEEFHIFSHPATGELTVTNGRVGTAEYLMWQSVDLGENWEALHESGGSE